MAKAQLVAILFICVLSSSSYAANILAIFPHTGKSHFFMFKPFAYELAARGHHVHVVTYFPDENPPPNITYINLRNDNEPVQFNSLSLEVIEAPMKFSRSLASLVGLRQMGIETCEKLGHPNVQKLISNPPKFDLAIVEFFNTDCFASLAHVFNVPLIGIFSAVAMPWHCDRYGIPDNPAYIPNHFLPHKSSMNFFERVVNTFATFSTKLLYRLAFNSADDAAVLKHLGPGIPPVREIVKKASLFLINSHFSLFQSRPLVPGIIELGGLHVEPPKNKIPAEVLRFIEGAENGVIFFSLGSTAKGSTMPKDKLRIFQKVFSTIPMRILWKWEDDTMDGKPDNVLLGKWFPQNDILAHPNVKLFVTHGGLMGTEEAFYHGVPMLVMPLFGDQPVNAASIEEKGTGVVIDYYSLSEDSLSQALETILNDKRYTERAKEASKIFLDRPLNIMDTAIYWTEYAIRYKGAPHLRSAVVDLAWYQEYLLDVFTFFGIAVAISFYLLKSLVKGIRKLFVGKPKNKTKKHKSN